MDIDMQDYQAPADLLQDRIVLVTGAGDGIGRAAALAYAAHGATVLLLGRTAKKLESVYDRIEAAGQPTPVVIPLDLESASAADMEQLRSQIGAEFGRLDGLLHNAGILGQLTPLANYDPDTWLRVIQVNLNAPFLLTQALLPLLELANDASVIFTTSSVGRVGRAFWGAYAVSKFATEGLMQTWADEVEGIAPIRINCINPGGTRTRMRAQAYPGENPLDRPAPEAIMATYLYLMGPQSRGITGQSLNAQQ